MAGDTFMSKLRTFLGLGFEAPRNDFRNPIWGSDDDDDDDDELYTRQRMDLAGEIDLHREITKHVHDMFKNFGGMFGDVKSFFHDDHLDSFTSVHGDEPSESADVNSNSIRDYYLKPGYHSHKCEAREDVDLDGKISSQDISGLLKKKDEGPSITTISPFDGNLVPGRAFCKTIITTSITKSDGTVETRKIVKNGNEVVEETTTLTGPDGRGQPGLNAISSTGIIFSELTSLFKNFY